MFTGTHDYSPAEWARFEAWLDRVYVDFTGKVAEGRKLPKEKVLEIAKGRIWSGADAKNLGLVDELGGYDMALKLVKKAIGVADSEDVNLMVYPRPKKWYETVVQQNHRRQQRQGSCRGSACPHPAGCAASGAGAEGGWHHAQRA